ncbi:MAG: RdgB/HAM1 family non-canonical purine NTP pyrophosphatase [Elusimicrobia bacterium]|nr:RdgB/HAM1 family non-canonical purine NTP pyrophosphatase [Elusimicrobiota bacterium]
MMRLVLATRNRHKISEISELLKGLPVELAWLDSFPGLAETVEDEPSIEGNARKKAVESCRATGLPALADDTGLEVEALGGAPGVLSARYAGPDCDYPANNDKLLRALKGVPAPRRALFRTVMALAHPSGEVALEEGRLEGAISERPRGQNGFGYDPVFLIPSLGKTLAELSSEEKNGISHRSKALRKIVAHIRKAALALAALALISPAAWSGKTEPGQETVWDKIMASQAHRGLRLGIEALESRQYELAVKEFSRAVLANPKDHNAHMMLGAALYWTGQVEESLQSYRKSLELEPANGQAYMLTGISLAWKGDMRGAYAAFQKAAELEPERGDVQMNLGSIEESLGMAQQAMGRFRRATLLAPKEPLYHFQLGMLYRKMGRDQEASDSFRQALKLYPQFEDALLELGAIEERQGQKKAAIHSFKKAVSLKSRDSVARFRLGRLYLLTGDKRKARDVMGEAFHLTPEDSGGGLQLSVAYAGGQKKSRGPSAKGSEPEREDPNEPLSIFRRNLERIPLDQSALMQTDVVFVPKPKLVKASPESGSSLKRALEQAAQTERSAPKAVRREYQISAGTPAQREQQINRLIQDLRDVLKQAPEDADVRLGMNLNFKRLAQVPASGRQDADSEPKVSYQPRAVGNDMGLWIIGTGWMGLVDEVLPEPGESPSHPDESDWWVATGLGYATLGDGQRALASFERACQLDPENMSALLGRGVAQVMTGNEEAAASSYREALRISPKNRPAKEGLKWLLRPSTKTGGKT